MEKYVSVKALLSKATKMYGFGDTKYVSEKAIKSAEEDYRPQVCCELKRGNTPLGQYRYCSSCGRAVVSDFDLIARREPRFCPWCGAFFGTSEEYGKYLEAQARMEADCAEFDDDWEDLV